MANVELATAYVSLVPTMKGLQGKVAQALAPASGEAEAAGRASGGRFSGAFKALIGPAVALAASGMFAGFIGEAAKASDATDKFKATMSFAGLDSSAITKATAAAKDFADQTVYDLPTIQNTIAQLASNGVKDYTGLTKAAGNLNAVAGGNADTFKSVAMVMTQTAGAGKLTTENWNQMADAIPGAAGPLMKSLEKAGAYTGNFRDAMAAGEITSEEFNAALMKLGNDPVAVEAAKSTKTFEGAIGNLEATINSGLMGALDAMKPAITGVINLLAGGLGKAFEWTGKAATGLIDLFAKGDFTGALAAAFNVEEDSGFVDFLFKARDAALTLVGGFRAMFAAYKAGDGDITSSGFAGVMERIGGGLREGVGAVRAFFAAFAAGGDEITSSGFAGVLEGLGLKARALFDKIGPAISSAFAVVGPVIGQFATALGPLLPQFFALFSAVSPIQTIFQAIAPLLPQLLGVFSQLAGVIGQTLSGALTALLPVFIQLQAVFVQIFQQVLATALPLVVQLVTMFGQAFAQLVPVIVPIITQVVTLAATLMTQLAPIFMQLVSTVLPMVVTIMGAVMQSIAPLISMIAGLLIPIIQALMPVVVTVFSVISSVITAAMQTVQGIIQVVTGIISGNWSQVWTGIRNIFSGIWNTIVAIVGGALRAVGQVVISGVTLAANFIRSAFQGAASFLGGIWNNIVSGVSGMIGRVTGFFSGLVGRITGAIGNAGSALFSVGVNIIQGLINGIGSMMGAIGRAVLNIVPAAIRGPFEDLLGIASPSKVFRGYGVNIGQGLILGIGDMNGRIEDAVTGMVTVPTPPSYGAATGGRDYRTAGVGGSTYNIYEADDPIATAHAVTRRQSALAT